MLDYSVPKSTDGKTAGEMMKRKKKNSCERVSKLLQLNDFYIKSWYFRLSNVDETAIKFIVREISCMKFPKTEKNETPNSFLVVSNSISTVGWSANKTEMELICCNFRTFIGNPEITAFIKKS